MLAPDTLPGLPTCLPGAVPSSAPPLAPCDTGVHGSEAAALLTSGALGRFRHREPGIAPGRRGGGTLNTPPAAPLTGGTCPPGGSTRAMVARCAGARGVAGCETSPWDMSLLRPFSEGAAVSCGNRSLGATLLPPMTWLRTEAVRSMRAAKPAGMAGAGVTLSASLAGCAWLIWYLGALVVAVARAAARAAMRSARPKGIPVARAGCDAVSSSPSLSSCDGRPAAPAVPAVLVAASPFRSWSRLPTVFAAPPMPPTRAPCALRISAAAEADGTPLGGRAAALLIDAAACCSTFRRRWSAVAGFRVVSASCGVTAVPISRT